MRTVGPIAWMARNPVAANLLMLLIFAGGFLGMCNAKKEVFPAFSPDVIAVAVPYPGASPAEVEQGIVLAVEEAVRGIDGVKRVNSQSAEGSGTVTVELLIDADADQVLSDVKTAVDRIRSFPEEAEDPKVALASRRSHVISVLIAGDVGRKTLHGIAEKARADLLGTGEVTQVSIGGVPPLEVAIEVRRSSLEAYGLSFVDVSRQVAAASLELPGGGIDTRAGEILVRVADRKRDGDEFGDIIVAATDDGSVVRLRDVAAITDGYADTDEAIYFDGRPAVRLSVYRTGDETPKGIATIVKDYAGTLEETLPAGVSLHPWDDDSKMLEARISLLTRNALLGGFLVVLVLALFLDLRLAFWVSLGIPITYLGMLALMPALDVSINMITLFAFIVTLGLVVDDAIVVGEAAYEKMESGLPPLDAAIAGARQMAVPVTFAILTSIAAFSPLLTVPGVMGKIFKLIPAVVIGVLAFSLIESFFVLPAHLGHGPPSDRRGNRVNRAVQARLQGFIERRYKPFLRVAIANRAIVIATAVALFAVTIGTVASGRVPFHFFPRIESDVVVASARLPYGSPLAQTERVKEILEASAAATRDRLGGGVEGMISNVGRGPEPRGPARSQEIGGHLVAIELQLVDREAREYGAHAFAAAWRKATPPLAGVETISFSGGGGPSAGADIAIQLSHADTAVLEQASRELEEAYRGYDQLTNIANEFAAGKPQLDFHLKPEARTLGLTAQDVAAQLRGSLFGAEALREQRGRNELKVMVRLPADQRASEHDLRLMQIRTPAGGHVPLLSVAEFERGRSPTSIDREGGKRVVNITADLKPGIDSPREVREDLEGVVLPELLASHPGLGWAPVGSQRAQKESMRALGMGYLLALIAIYALLAVPFRSYVQPVIIMSAIPFGFVGAVLGHAIMGFELSLMSFFGIVALSGVVVNDSLVLIDATNRFKAEGRTAREAIEAGAARRFRPILLTSLTTFFGLAPMLLETDPQARFLIPMAVSLGFGVLFATLIVLILVPALYLVVEDIRAWFAATDEELDARRSSPPPTLPDGRGAWDPT